MIGRSLILLSALASCCANAVDGDTLQSPPALKQELQLQHPQVMGEKNGADEWARHMMQNLLEPPQRADVENSSIGASDGAAGGIRALTHTIPPQAVPDTCQYDYHHNKKTLTDIVTCPDFCGSGRDFILTASSKCFYYNTTTNHCDKFGNGTNTCIVTGCNDNCKGTECKCPKGVTAGPQICLAICPTVMPSAVGTDAPTMAPAPGVVTKSPVSASSSGPTVVPAESPTLAPSIVATKPRKTMRPSSVQTLPPSLVPSVIGTITPSIQQTFGTTSMGPTMTASFLSDMPSDVPSEMPTSIDHESNNSEMPSLVQQPTVASPPPAPTGSSGGPPPPPPTPTGGGGGDIPTRQPSSPTPPAPTGTSTTLPPTASSAYIIITTTKMWMGTSAIGMVTMVLLSILL